MNSKKPGPALVKPRCAGAVHIRVPTGVGGRLEESMSIEARARRDFDEPFH